MTEAEWEQRFPLLPNHLDPDASWTIDEGPGCLFETYGEELQFVLQQNPRRVWTLLDNDEVVNGIHVVNRAGYFVSRKPWLKGANICVKREH